MVDVWDRLRRGQLFVRDTREEREPRQATPLPWILEGMCLHLRKQQLATGAASDRGLRVCEDSKVVK